MLSHTPAPLRLAAGAARHCRRCLSSTVNAASATTGRPEPTSPSGSREHPRDAVGPSAQGGRMVVQPPLPNMSMADPAAPDAPVGLLQRASEAVQDLFRLPSTRGHAYHYAEDTARAVVKEQQECGKDRPGVESMYAPTSEEVGDAITAPRSWHFSNRTEEEQQPPREERDLKL